MSRNSIYIQLAISGVLLLLVSGLLTDSSFAQILVEGTVKDAETAMPLPSATLIVKGTYSGTVTNLEGRYSLRLDSLPATVQVRYIGYHSQAAYIQSQTDTTIHFYLEPSSEQLDEIVVTDEDPAVRIMREVIRRKKQWRPQINNYKAEAYTRAVLENDTSIVSITETISAIYWNRDKGHREVIKSRRQTNNIAEDQNFTGVNYVPNFYDDNIEIAEFELIGPTHPEALKFYAFKLLEQRQIDGQTVYVIQVIPDKKLQPLFKGTIYILNHEYAMLQADLIPNDVVRFPPPVRNFDLAYKQQFRNFRDSLWLPVDMQVSGQLKIKLPGLNFPMINFRQLSRITDYTINTQLPDSLFRNDDIFTVDSTSISGDSLFLRTAEVVPLSEEEKVAYTNIDSTQTLEEAFKPTGALAGVVNNTDDSSGNNLISKLLPGQFSLQARFNRVDEFFGGLAYEKNLFDERLLLSSSGGYATGYEEFNYTGGVDVWPLPHTRRFKMGFEYFKKTDTRYTSGLYTMAFTSFQPLFGAEDYFDYFLNRGFTVDVGYQLSGQDLVVRMQYNSEDHESLAKNTEYDLLGRDPFRRENPEIDPGDLRSLSWRVEIGTDITENVFGITGKRGAIIDIEHAGDYLNSDFSFTRYALNATYRFNTLYRRRFIPNTLDVNLRAGTFTGTLPRQRFGVVDGTLSSFSQFGALRSVRNIPLSGEHYVSFVAEHHFRTIPFEILGLNWPAERGWGLIAFGGLGRNWTGQDTIDSIPAGQQNLFPVMRELQSEIGLSLSGIFSLVRIDAAYQVNTASVFVGFGIARLF